MGAAGPIVIIGGGIGGLSAAIYLAAAGKEVVILEKNASLGGKMQEVVRDGFRWDTGPSVITMRPVFESLFAAVNRNLEDYLELLPIDPLTRYFYTDGSQIDATRNLQRIADQIMQLEPRDVEGYFAYLSYAARLYRITSSAFIFGDPPSLNTLRQVPLTDIRYIDGLRSMNSAIRNFIHSDSLEKLLNRFATYVGASPYRAPATLNVIGHVEMTGGVWYPRGGIYQIALALEKLALEMGVKILKQARVLKILHRN